MNITLRQAHALATALQQLLSRQNLTPVQDVRFTQLDCPVDIDPTTPAGKTRLIAAIQSKVASLVEAQTSAHQNRLQELTNTKLSICDLIQYIRDSIDENNHKNLGEFGQSITKLMAEKANIARKMVLYHGYETPYPKHGPSLRTLIDNQVSGLVNTASHYVNSSTNSGPLNLTVSAIRTCPEIHASYNKAYQDLKRKQSVCDERLAHANNTLYISLTPDQVSLVLECELMYIID